MTGLPEEVVTAQKGELLGDALGASRAARLTPKQRETVVEEFLALLEGLYAHLPLKRAMYGVDAIQRLRLLKRNVAQVDDLGFHREMADIVTDLRDAHTRYAGPARLKGRTAMLPFLVEMYGAPPHGPTYIVSNVVDNAELVGDPAFEAGVELTFWNGVPMDRAVDIHAEQETGGRPDSRRARALETLTLRSLQFGPPPDERWVVIGYIGLDGTEREVKIPWRVVAPGRAPTAGAAVANRGSALQFAIDPAREAARRTKQLLFAPRTWMGERQPQQPRAATRRSAITTTMPDVLDCHTVSTPSGEFGLLRLWSFDLSDDEPYLAEVIRLLGELPQDGLIIDLRGNPGGLIWAAERMLQLFTPRHIVPTRFSLLATELTREMARHNNVDFEPWLDSLAASVAMGELYSQAVPITPVERCNDIGQVYSGPVVAVVDANTYSAGDLFAAGFIDNEVGTLLTVGQATGAGGANVWGQDIVFDTLAGTDFKRTRLPAGITYTVSVRRATRGCGPAEGSAIEDVGVVGHDTYAMSYHDLVGGNEDLHNYCAKLLAEQDMSLLHCTPSGAGRSLSLTTDGLDRLDIYVDDRPQASLTVPVKKGTVKHRLPADWTQVEVQGFKGRRLRQRRIVDHP